MTTIHYDIANDVATHPQATDKLRAVLQQSGAYGTVSGALETLVGDSVREQDTRQSYAALVDAIHAPRGEATKIADELFRIAQNCVAKRHG